MNIKSLAYIGFTARDPAQWLRFGCAVAGMMPARHAPGKPWGLPSDNIDATKTAFSGIAADGSAFLKLDRRQWRIAVHPAETDGELCYLGLELDGPAAFQEAVAELEAAHYTVESGTVEEARGRSVCELAAVRDPAGNRIELVYGSTHDYNFQSPVPGVEFGPAHLGFGHINLFVADREACFDFYHGLLGFRLTDYIQMGDASRLDFLRCNARHHSIAISEMGGVQGIQHLMLEVGGIDQVGLLLDRALREGVSISGTLGRHRNDRTLSFYMKSPAGFDVEIGCDSVLIDETWTANQFCEGDVWGHAGLVDAVVESGMAMQAAMSADTQAEEA